MKIIFGIKILIYIINIQGFSQITPPNNSRQNTSDKYALIDDVKNLEFDTEKSKISFDFVEENTKGTISILDLKINFNPNDVDNASFIGKASVKTIDTNNFLRDGHLMWEKFFYKRKYPTISFKSNQVVSFGKNTYKVIGNLTIKGVEKEIIITFSLNDSKLLGKATIYTSDFNVNIHDERLKNKLDIEFHFPIVK